jgi:uncharacterized membrane protein
MKLRLRHLLGIALLVSIAVNVLLAGIVIGRWVDHDSRDGGPRFDRRAAHEALSPAGKEIADEIWQQRRPLLREKFKAVKDARRALEAELKADQVDRAKLEAAQAALSAAWAEARAEMAEGMTDLAVALPAEDRKAYFEKGKKHRKHDRRTPPPDRDGPPERDD